MHKTTVYFSEELRQRIKRTARKDGLSEAEVIRAAVYSYTEPLADRAALAGIVWHRGKWAYSSREPR